MWPFKKKEIKKPERHPDDLNPELIKFWDEDKKDNLIRDYYNMSRLQFVLKYRIHASDLRRVEEIMDSILQDKKSYSTFNIMDTTLPIYLTIDQVKQMDDYGFALLAWDYWHLQVDLFNMKYSFPQNDYNKLFFYIEKRKERIDIPRWIDG